jgi:hypothetical protein
MPYGYLGQNQPNQTVSNSGVFSITDVAELQSQGKLGGSLELIEEQTVSGSPTTIDFTSIKENVYDVMFLSIENFVHSGSTANIGLRFYESGVLETGSVYKYSQNRITTAGVMSEADRSTGASYILISPYSMNGGVGNYNINCHFYNFGNSNKYSFTTYQSVAEATSNGTGFGGGILPQASVVDGIQIYTFGRTITSGTAKLFGYKQ